MNKKYRIKYWSDRWQTYSYTTVEMVAGFSVGDIVWIKTKRCEILEVLD